LAAALISMTAAGGELGWVVAPPVSSNEDSIVCFDDRKVRTCPKEQSNRSDNILVFSRLLDTVVATSQE
jgi:hypothetical protein